MLPDFDDIIALTERRPDWYDAAGTPRYRDFTPDMLGVYDRFAVYAVIACQACRQMFRVGVGYTHENLHAVLLGDEEHMLNTLESIAGGFHYGDPPRHGGCSGETMNCDDLRIIEAWEKSRGRWARVRKLEGLIDADG